MIIYTIRNTVNGKQLIGQSVHNTKRRWWVHRHMARKGKHNNSYFQNAWNKDGEDAFIYEVIDETANNIDELNALEIFYIATTPNLYNLKSGGKNSCPSEETKRKIGEKSKGRIHSSESRRKMSEAHKGKKLSEEHKCKIGEAFRDKKLSEEHKCKIGEAHKGLKPSDETKRKLSEAKKGKKNGFYGKKHSAETRRKISEGLKGRKLSDESKRKMSESIKRMWANRRAVGSL